MIIHNCSLWGLWFTNLMVIVNAYSIWLCYVFPACHLISHLAEWDLLPSLHLQCLPMFTQVSEKAQTFASCCLNSFSLFLVPTQGRYLSGQAHQLRASCMLYVTKLCKTNAPDSHTFYSLLLLQICCCLLLLFCKWGNDTCHNTVVPC